MIPSYISVPITASYSHHWEWCGWIDLRSNNGEFHCSKCGISIDADGQLAKPYVDVANCPILYGPVTRPKIKFVFRHPFIWVLAGLELILGIIYYNIGSY